MNVTLSAEGLAESHILAERLRLSRSALVESLIRAAARSQGIEPEHVRELAETLERVWRG